MTFAALSTVCLVNGFTQTIRANTRLGLGALSPSYSSFEAFSSKKRINGRNIILTSSSSSRKFQTSSRLYATDKARVLFLGTPDVAATSLKTIVEESKKEGR